LLPELSRLVDLHELDKEIFELTLNLDKLPRELGDKDQEIAVLEAERSTQLQELENLTSQLREMEAEVTDLEEGIKASRSRLMDIGKELELKAMLKEIAFREDQRDQKETRVLELLDQVEALKQGMAEKDQVLKTLKGEHDRLSAEVATQVAELEKQRAALVGQREALRQRLPAPLLKRYEFILRRHNGSAICEVREGVCLGCHLNILPQQFIDLQKGEEIIQCPNCQRLLYWLGEEAEKEGADTQARKVS
jgi:predicted  nucleic acid-binding Zn-ribbon protein